MPANSDCVSVILPYYNRAETIRAAALSVLDQSYTHLILYLVNDGSSDPSREIARSLNDARVVHIDSPANGGACAARNLGLAAAHTDLVAFQDSDDLWLPGKLERQVCHLRKLQRNGQHVSVLGCGWRYRNPTSGVTIFSPGPFTRSDMLKGVAGTGTPMLLIDREMAALDAAFDPSFPSLEERDYVLSCLANGSSVAVLPEVLAQVTRGRADHLANPEKAALAWERYLAKYADDFATYPDLCSWYHFRAAREYMVAGNRRHSLPHVRKAVQVEPVRRAIHLVMGYVGGTKGLAIAQKVLSL